MRMKVILDGSHRLPKGVSDLEEQNHYDKPGARLAIICQADSD